MKAIFALLVLVAALDCLKAEFKPHPHALRAYLTTRKFQHGKLFNDPFSRRGFPTAFPGNGPTMKPIEVPEPIKGCIDEAEQCHKNVEESSPNNYCAHWECIKKTSECIEKEIPISDPAYLPCIVKCCADKAINCVLESCSCKGRIACAIGFGFCAEIIE